MQVTTFQEVAARFVRALSARDDVRVLFQGTAAFTQPDGTIVLPALPPGTLMSRHESDVFRGYLDHEAGHVLFSDFGAITDPKDPTRPREELRDPGGQTLQWLWNAIEDPREENCYIDALPGARRNLDTVRHYVDEKEKVEGGSLTWYQAALALVAREVYKFRGCQRSILPGLTLESLGLPEVQRLVDEGFPALRSAHDSFALALQVMEHLRAQAPDQEELEGMAQEHAEGRPSGDGPSAGDGEGNGDGDGDASSASSDGFPREVGSFEDPGATASLPASCLREALGDLLSQVEQRNARAEGQPDRGRDVVEFDPRNQGHRSPDPWKGNTWLPPVGTHQDRILVYPREDLQAFRRELAAVSSHVRAAKQQLRRFLQSRMKRGWERGLEEGILDDDALVDHVVSGTRRVRKARVDRSLVRTDVALVVDLSSSMNADLLRQACITLAEALSTIRVVKLGIFGFTTNERPYSERDYTRKFGRAVGLDIMVLKDFDDPYRRCHGYLGGIGTWGATPLGEGYAHGFDVLVRREAPRKVLWLVTDGDPCYRAFNPAHNDHVLIRRIRAKARNCGIETLGLGITLNAQQQQKLRRMVERVDVIDRMDQFPRALLDITRSVIVRQA